ncbi:unnamed protein product [Chilo suppressalis]|uniref:tRNA-splicing endonuclease subunit Sen34 n=1 Tax=Chilo suppressalis TaxID=168631 RepID=A0ABN8AUG3_CHISP|nr:unnamed protein product [Chilo suppressalis]
MIRLFVKNGVAYVWNAEDWYLLRSEHRICGSLIGSIASYPRQNEFLGLPMALMSEEAALLVEKGICELCEIPNLTKAPSKEEKAYIKECEQRIVDEQREGLRKRRIEQMSQKLDIIAAGKKQKLQSKGITDVQLDKEALLQEEINKLPKLSPAYLLVHLPTEHFKTSDRKLVSIDVLRPSVEDRDGNFRYCVYKDLWDKGHHVTNGLKFGSDFLVYPGDPVRFHATYMVRCIYDKATPFRPANLVAFGRLSVAVNKLAVLAFYNSSEKIDYQTLQWHDGVNI